MKGLAFDTVAYLLNKKFEATFNRLIKIEMAFVRRADWIV